MGWSPPSHLPHLYSDLFDLGNGAVGEVDSRLAIVEDWEAKFRRGIIYYLKDNHVRGVLRWNAFGLVDAARELIGARQQLPARDLAGPAARQPGDGIGDRRETAPADFRTTPGRAKSASCNFLLGGNMKRQVSKRTGWSWWYLLFLIQFVAVLWPPFYNRAEPSLIGLPFFYWYQLLWIIIGAILTAIVYFVTDD